VAFLVDGPGGLEEAVRQGGLPMIDVRDDAEVPDMGLSITLGH
jgi:hypothetical protein